MGGHASPYSLLPLHANLYTHMGHHGTSWDIGECRDLSFEGMYQEGERRELILVKNKDCRSPMQAVSGVQ